MRTLVIDTATEACSVALFDGERLLARRHMVVGRGHAERLLPMIAELPGEGQADRIAVDVGPGSFTGVRIGLAAARALAFAWSAELTGYSALSMIAAQARNGTNGSEPIAVAITGGHGELFWQRFSGDTLQPLTEPASMPIAEVAAKLQDERIFGTGAAALVSARGWGEAVAFHPDSGDFFSIPSPHVQLAPKAFYGRGADARPTP